MSIVSAISSARDVLKSVFVPIKRQFGYVMFSKSYVRDLQKEVDNLLDMAERVENAVQEDRNNLRMVSIQVIKWQRSAKNALKDAGDLLGDFEKASNLRDLSCRYRFSRNAKRKIELIQRLARECSEFENISFDVGALTSSPRVERGLHPVSDLLRWAVTAIRYVFSSEIYAQDLQKEVGKLEYEVDWVHLAMEEAEKSHRIVYSRVLDRHKSADEALKEATHLLDDFKGASKTWCCGTLPDPRCHYEFSTKAKDKIKGIQELTRGIREYKKLDDICFSAGFESRASVTRDIVDALANNSNRVVGIHGMGGVGKSTLLVKLENRIREERSFDWIAKADVSENPDIKRIQGEIAHCLGLTDIKNKESIGDRAELLRKRLEMEERDKKTVLIILDNLWKGLDLKSVGIPCGHDNKVIGCKLLLTSRSRDVLRREMCCDRDFFLGGLKEEEAKRLFETIVGGKVHGDEFRPLVDEALHKCAGVPLLILAIAKRFKDGELSEWKDTLKTIEMSKDKGVNDVINKMLQLSYDDLDEEAKLTLRLCIVYGVSEPSLENLVRYGVGLGLYGECSIEEARNRLRSLIRTLQAASLLLENGGASGFKIHDLVREFVASVTSTDRPLLVLKDKDTLVTELSEDKLKSCEAMCFPYVDLEELPEELVCPELRIFLLFEYSYKSHKISDSYFNSMKNLMVLHLTGISLTRSPSPFQSLEKLHSLCLEYCSLEDVAVLGELKGLQILSLQGSNIQRLPKEIGQLVELRLLDLSHCVYLEIIEPDVLGSLTKLEELYMKDSFRKWNAVEQTTPTNASLIELNRMENLRTLHMRVGDPNMLPEDLNLEKFAAYEIQIGYWQGWPTYNGSRTLVLTGQGKCDVLRMGCIQSILGKIDNLFLCGFDEMKHEMKQSLCMLSRNGFPKLKHLQVEACDSIHYILRSTSHTNFNMLESLILENLINLEKICCGHIFSKSFSALKVVRVEGCHKMEVLFPLSVTRELLQLEEVEVVDCEIVQGIVEVDDCGRFELPKLRILKLRELPDIKNFFTVKTIPSTSTSNDPVWTQIAFFNGQQVAFPRLETLEITGLDNLEYIFFPSMVKCFAQLRELRVSNCVKMQAIITEEEGREIEASENLAFPNLTYLELRHLESLTCFSREKCSQESQSNNRVKSRSIALFNREVMFPSLETLNIFAINNIETIWDKEVYFRQLKALDVSFCDGLSHLFTLTIAGNLVELTKARISNCRILTEVIICEGGEDECVLAFQQLKYLELHALTGLRCFSASGHTLMFPLLEDVVVIGCLNMEFFSEGPIEAPKLDRVQVTKHEVWFWKKNLNVTIQNMFEGMATIAGVTKMRMSEYPELIEKWHSELIPIKSSWQLRSLVVDKCPSFINAVSSRLMLVLEYVSTLQVRDCELLEEIFDLEGIEDLGSTRVLPSFQTLDLINLPNLRRLWNKDLQGTMCFNSLCNLILYKCSNLRHAFTPSMARCLVNLFRMEIKECGQMEGVIADEEWQGSVEGKITFPNLWEMELECLPNLTSFLLGKNHTLDCPQLHRLTIGHCPKMRSLTWQSLMENDLDTPSLFTPQVQFPQLESMVLSDMDSLSKIWTNNPLETLTCGNLRKVEIHNCKSLEIMFPHWLATRLNIQELRVESCGLEEIVASADNTLHSTIAQFLFPDLTSLALHDMPRLRSFCPNFPTLKWPSLRELRVTHCDKLNMLSSMELMKKWTQRNHEQDLSHGEAQSSFERDFSNLERFLLVDKDIQMIQDGKFSNDIFRKPEALTLACFHEKNAVFPSRFLTERFQNLKSLEVFCSSFEYIFPDEGFADEGKHPMLESLRELKLSKLHKLKRVWRENYLVSKVLQSIKTLEVWDCPGLTALFPIVTSFQNLTKLVVKNSSGLLHLGIASAITNLVSLVGMTIIGCEKMKEVVAKDENGEGKVISFRKLRRLRLQNMPSLECFSSTTSCILRFPSLWKIEVEECPKMKIFSKGKLSTPNLQFASLFRYKWEFDWEGDLNATIRRLSA